MSPWRGLVGLLLLFLQLATFTAAWPWPPTLKDIGGLVIKRADTQSAAASTASKAKATATPKASKTQKPASASVSGSSVTSAPAFKSQSATSGGSAKTKATSGAKKTKAAASKTTKAAKVTAVDPRLPAGGVDMMTPASTAQTTYYKVGDEVTFGWNYTSLSIPPHAVDVYVTCTANSATYTISNNMTFHSSAKVVWDTKPEKTGDNPLLTDQYTLVIHDAAKDVTQVASAGYLGAYQQFTFGMYTPQPYENRSTWQCAVCSGAISDMERQTLKFMFGMCVITVLSFTWFVGGIGLLH